MPPQQAVPACTDALEAAVEVGQALGGQVLDESPKSIAAGEEEEQKKAEKKGKEDAMHTTATLFEVLAKKDDRTAPLTTCGLPENLTAGPLEFPSLTKFCDSGEPTSLDAKPKTAADSVTTYDSSALSGESSLKNRGVWDVAAPGILLAAREEPGSQRPERMANEDITDATSQRAPDAAKGDIPGVFVPSLTEKMLRKESSGGKYLLQVLANTPQKIDTAVLSNGMTQSQTAAKRAGKEAMLKDVSSFFQKRIRQFKPDQRTSRKCPASGEGEGGGEYPTGHGRASPITGSSAETCNTRQPVRSPAVEISSIRMQMTTPDGRNAGQVFMRPHQDTQSQSQQQHNNGPFSFFNPWGIFGSGKR